MQSQQHLSGRRNTHTPRGGRRRSLWKSPALVTALSRLRGIHTGRCITKSLPRTWAGELAGECGYGRLRDRRQGPAVQLNFKVGDDEDDGS